jgi:hypothetical protein
MDIDMDKERLQELGRIAVVAAELEYYLYAVVCELTSENIETARMAVGNRQFDQLKDMAGPLLVAAGLGDKTGELDEFLALALKAMDGRNAILHGPWINEAVQARRKGNKRVEVSIEDLTNARYWLENAATGMSFMWIEIISALNRLKLDKEGRVILPDRTGTPKTIEKPPQNRVMQQRWGRGSFSLNLGLSGDAGAVADQAERDGGV